MNKIKFGNCLEVMQEWIDQGVKVNTCVTSPPYYGLRDYGRDEQIGLEETPEQYVENICKVFDLVYELLEDDGTLWLNLGDSYAGNCSRASNNGRAGFGNKRETVTKRISEGLKSKDLIGIPWMVAFALRSRGWYLRQDIIWSKTNPIPESVRDRCTKSHEHIFLLSKSPKYYFDFESIKEPSQDTFKGKRGKVKHRNKTQSAMTDRTYNYEYSETATRRKRDVWTVSVKPYKGAHFAVYPTDLIEPCIKAGCPENGIVLDPFMGSGTTAMVAKQNNRQYLGCELNSDYAELQQERIDNV